MPETERKMPTVTRIRGVFPLIQIERDVAGLPKKVIVQGTFDKLEVIAHATPDPWLEVKFNGEEYTYE